MPSSVSGLKGKTVAVVGFNARPLACSAKRAGAEVLVSDYWGDDDLSTCCDDWVAVLTPTPGHRQRQPLDAPLHVILVDNLVHLLGERTPDYIFVGSGFDDHPESLTPIETTYGLQGNGISQFMNARNKNKLAQLCEDHRIDYPKSRKFSSIGKFIQYCKSMPYPCIVRPSTSGGGSGITLVRNNDEARVAFQRINGEDQDKPVIAQQYVRGIDISTSVLSTGHHAITLSLQGQLIGMPSAGRNCDFVYCGNYMPLGVSQSVSSKLRKISESLCVELGLNGSNGVDFVLDMDQNIWLMEVNPRFQGTLEMLEVSGKCSVSSLHCDALRDNLPSTLPDFKPSVKMILYSQKTGAVPDLSLYPNTVDRTPPGVQVQKNDPICTIIETNGELKDCYRRVSATAIQIQRGIQSISDS
ncbi:MAG: ATP-grasp domain-containing protein, partial [Candidatus Hodarchaeota archaeon]